MKDTWSSPEYNLLPKLRGLTIPTLVIYGDHDFIPSATAVHITQAIPNARMVTLKDCGHFSYLECPVSVREQIGAFFRDSVRPAALPSGDAITSYASRERVWCCRIKFAALRS